MSTAIKEPPNHNKMTCYTDYHCRRPECVDRYNAWNRNRSHALAAGTWQPFVDAEPVRQHLLKLHAAGISIHRVSVVTGLTFNSVRLFTQHSYGNRRPRKRRTTHEIAAKILAIGFDTAAGRIDSTGTQRRIQALVAIGWPMEHVASRAGLSTRNICTLSRRTHVLASTAEAINRAYDEMRNGRPERRDVSKTQAKKARNRALARRWPPPKYWDVCGAIDDPDFTPYYKVTQPELVAEEAHFLVEVAGLSLDDVAQKLGKERWRIERLMGEYPAGASA